MRKHAQMSFVLGMCWTAVWLGPSSTDCQKMKVYMQLIVFTTARIFYFIASCFHFSCQVQLNFIVYFSIIFPESIYVAKWLQSSTFDPRSGFTDHSITSVLSHDTAEKMPKVTINTIDKTSISWSE